MDWPWQKRPKGLEERTNAIRMGTARLEANVYPSREAMEADLSVLLALKEDNRNIAEMTKTLGWVEYEAALTKLAMDALRRLPDNHIKKDPDADWDAHLVKTINVVLLGLVSNAIYESANVDRLINTKLTAKARLEETERNAR